MLLYYLNVDSDGAVCIVSRVRPGRLRDFDSIPGRIGSSVAFPSTQTGSEAHPGHWSVGYRALKLTTLATIWCRGLQWSQNCEKRLLASSCLSVRPHGTSRLPLEGFTLNFISEYSSKICWENSSFIKIRKYCHLWDNMKKDGSAGEATDDNTTHVLCMLDN
jgi:hypothetical protein